MMTIESNSNTWAYIKKDVERKINIERDKLEGERDPISAAESRGRIQALKSILQLEKLSKSSD